MTTVTAPRPASRGWFGIVELSWFITLLATALAMAAAMAHALELPNKLAMNEQDYFAAQQSYRGWNQLAILLSIEATGMIALAISYRRVKPIRWRMLVALAMLVLAQLAFWFFTFPANQGTENWTVAPQTWEQLRSQWEFSHLSGAIFQLLAFCFVILAVLRWADLKPREQDC
jgi:multisubunit Na+/H+ antiporter MnhB subunit